MDYDSDSSHSDTTSPVSFYPPSLDDLYDKLKNAKGSLEILTVCSFLDCKINDLPTYIFTDDTERNQYGIDLYTILNEARGLYRASKLKEREEDNIFRNWGFSSEQDVSLDFKTISRKTRIKSPSPPNDASSAKKQRITDQPTCQNKYASLNVEDPPEDVNNANADHSDMEQSDDPPRASTPVQHIRPPPPITIDNVDQSGQFLKKLQDLTNSKLSGRMVGTSLRVYPETPVAYKQIRSYLDDHKMQAFTYQLKEDKEFKVVLRGMPADMSPKKLWTIYSASESPHPTAMS
ncbi:hypothetical protein TNCT_416501 [Trichonephila clavata]|uniref:Uncharacterized protein n=1 Tax=Trichonephila clavata TaxID=2740835 RepID=A0A8X6FQQ2_TRICU|nr:hypothetical protein TNCT_416501 [Trichonephila clavata]